MKALANKTTKQVAAGLLGLSVVGAGLAAALPAGATIPASVSVSAGTLTATLPSTITLSSVTLNGVDQTSTGSLAVDVKDATGSGTGWKLQATSTTFKDTGSNTLPASATTIASSGAVTDTCDANATCTLAQTQGVSYPYTLPAASTAPTATTFYNAKANTGMGNQTATASFSVAIPANTFVPAGGAYTSTWTITSASAP